MGQAVPPVGRDRCDQYGLESQVSAHLQIARAGLSVADYRESVEVDAAGGGVGHPAASTARVAERHGIGQVERLAHQLEPDPLFLEREDTGDASVHIEKTRTAQDVSAGGSQNAVRRIGKRAAIEIGMAGIVAAQDDDIRIDLVGAITLAGPVEIRAGVHRERHATGPGQRAAELPPADYPGCHAMVQQRMSPAGSVIPLSNQLLKLLNC